MIAVRHGNGGGANPPRPLSRMIGGSGALVSVGGTSAPCPSLSLHPVVWSGCASESDPASESPPLRGRTDKFSSDRGTSHRVAGSSRATRCGSHHPQVWHGTAPRVVVIPHPAVEPAPPSAAFRPGEGSGRLWSRASSPQFAGAWMATSCHDPVGPVPVDGSPAGARLCGWSGSSVTLRRTTEYVHRALGGLVAARLATHCTHNAKAPGCVTSRDATTDGGTRHVGHQRYEIRRPGAGPAGRRPARAAA